MLENPICDTMLPAQQFADPSPQIYIPNVFSRSKFTELFKIIEITLAQKILPVADYITMLTLDSDVFKKFTSLFSFIPPIPEDANNEPPEFEFTTNYSKIILLITLNFFIG
ncbi:Hypothetical_protein [Hexamita inflata]|uniref:Hypothetical_protein n=1 Tax=Hexamita inflata TaxID=28002 RepID=A0AA86PSW6_9EUKA|nr:Hypothetical protein HINF_LOCUS28585 [Hexamita inflata]